MAFEEFITAFNQKEAIKHDLRDAEDELKQKMRDNLPELITKRIVRISINVRNLQKYL